MKKSKAIILGLFIGFIFGIVLMYYVPVLLNIIGFKKDGLERNSIASLLNEFNGKIKKGSFFAATQSAAKHGRVSQLTFMKGVFFSSFLFGLLFLIISFFTEKIQYSNIQNPVKNVNITTNNDYVTDAMKKDK